MNLLSKVAMINFAADW